MGFSVWQMLIILVIVLLLFGTKKLRNIGSDLGSAIKSFRSSVGEPKEEAEMANAEQIEQGTGGTVIEGEVAKKETDKA